MPRWSQVHLIPRIETILRSQRSRLATALFAFLLLMPMAALAQGSPFDTGFNAIQGLFTGTIAKVASLVAIVIGGYGFAHGEPGAKKALAGVAAGNGHSRYGSECLELALGRIAPPSAPRLDEGLMPDKPEQQRRTNRVFKSLHKPLTYLGVERTLFGIRLCRCRGSLQSLQFHPCGHFEHRETVKKAAGVLRVLKLKVGSEINSPHFRLLGKQAGIKHRVPSLRGFYRARRERRRVAGRESQQVAAFLKGRQSALAPHDAPVAAAAAVPPSPTHPEQGLLQHVAAEPRSDDAAMPARAIRGLVKACEMAGVSGDAQKLPCEFRRTPGESDRVAAVPDQFYAGGGRYRIVTVSAVRTAGTAASRSRSTACSSLGLRRCRTTPSRAALAVDRSVGGGAALRVRPVGGSARCHARLPPSWPA